MADPFCEAFWFVGPYRHACLYRKGHAGSCWCCDNTVGGDLDDLLAESTVADQQGSDAS